MDFTSKSKQHGSTRRFILERKQRISIEDRGSLLIKDTQTQVRELYRRDITHKEEETSSSLVDTNILKTSLQVDALNRKIENEIDKLKHFRDIFLEADNKQYRNQKINLLPSTNKCPVRVSEQKENNSEKVIKDSSSASDQEEMHRSNKSSPNTDLTESVFHTMNLTSPSSPLVSNPQGQPKCQTPVAEGQPNETTFNLQDNTERICGGCLFKCDAGTPIPYTTYQSEYMPISHCCQNYGGICHCHANACCPSYLTAPMHVSYPANSFQYENPSCLQQQQIAYGMSCCSCCQPTCCRQSTDLRTNYFGRHWCAPSVANAPTRLQSTSSSPRRSGKITKSRSRYPSAHQQTDNKKVELNAVKLESKKLKSAKLEVAKPEAAEEEAARLKADKLEAAMENAKLKVAPMGGPISEQHVDESVIINGYVPANEPASKRHQDDEEIMRMHREYIKIYKKEHDKSAQKESNINTSELETKDQKEKGHTAQWIGPSYCKPSNSKGNNLKKSNNSRGIEIIDRIVNTTKSVKCDEVCSTTPQCQVDEVCSEYSIHVTVPDRAQSNRFCQHDNHQFHSIQFDQSLIDRNSTAEQVPHPGYQSFEYAMQLDCPFPDRSEIPDQSLSGYLSRDSYRTTYPVHNFQVTPDTPRMPNQNDPSYQFAPSRQGTPDKLRISDANVFAYQSMDRVEHVCPEEYPMLTVQTTPNKQIITDHTKYDIQSPIRFQQDTASSNKSRMPVGNDSEAESTVRLQRAKATRGNWRIFNQSNNQLRECFQSDCPKIEMSKPTTPTIAFQSGKPHPTLVSTTLDGPKTHDPLVQSNERPLDSYLWQNECQEKSQRMSPKQFPAMQAQHPQASADEQILLDASLKFNKVDCFCQVENINPENNSSLRFQERFPETPPSSAPKSSSRCAPKSTSKSAQRSAPNSIHRSYTESSDECNPVSSSESNESFSSKSYLETSPDNNRQCSLLVPSRGNIPLQIDHRNQIESENTEYTTCQEYIHVGRGRQSDQEDQNSTMLSKRAMNTSMKDIYGYTANDNASSSEKQASVQREFYGNFASLSEQRKLQLKMPIKSTYCEKRTRLVTFKDEDGVSVQSNTIKSCRSIIDWERAHELAIKDEKLYDDSDSTDDDIQDSCRSSSMADTEFTCIESNNEDDYVTCTESNYEPECYNLPPFTGCCCMYHNYLRLAAICD